MACIMIMDVTSPGTLNAKAAENQPATSAQTQAAQPESEAQPGAQTAQPATQPAAQAAQPASQPAERTGIAAAAGFFAYVPFGSGRTVNITTVNVHGRDYLFLPSAVSESGVTFHYNEAECSIFFSDGKPCKSDARTDLRSYLSADCGDGSKLMTLHVVKAGADSQYDLHVMCSDNISSMYLTSSDPAKGRSYVEANKSNKAAGNMTMLTGKGVATYDGALTQIKGRGNTTFAADKKPYQIKLATSTDLTRKGSANSGKTWVLLANAYDPTMIHNTVGLNMARDMGLNAPDCVPVDLYYDGEYRGNYLLTEKVEVASGRVEITDLESKVDAANSSRDVSKCATAMGANKYGDVFSYVTGVTNPDSISGGYLLELDNAYYKSERSYFLTSTGVPFVVKSPENCSREMMIYVSEYVEQIVQASANGGIVPENGRSIWELIDKDSLVKYFVFEEIVKNADSFASSTYFYLNDDGKPMKAGPVWDLDDTYGVRTDMASAEGFCSGGFIQPFMNLPEFRKAVKTYYSSTGHSRATGTGIDSYVKETSRSQKMNRVLWNDSKQIYSKLETYDADVNYMKTFATARAKWLKGIFATW